MNIEDVKQIPIADYLHSLGYSPVKQQGNGLWYKSPLREEHEPSFKVNTDRNLWYDFGAGKGGNIIALAKELYCSDSLPYLLNRIAEQTPHVRPVSFSFPQNLDVLLKPIPQAIGMAQTIMTIRLILLAGVAPKYSHAKQSLRATKIID